MALAVKATSPRGATTSDAYSFDELRAAWVRAGGRRGGWDVIMAAVALAESKGRRLAHYVTAKEDSRGPWQINVLAHPEYRNVNLYDLNANARAAVGVFNSQGPDAWTTFRDGAWRKALAAAKFSGPLGSGADNVPGIKQGIGAARGAEGAVSGAVGAVSGIPDAITGGLHELEQYAVHQGTVILAYLVLTAAALVLFGLGLSRVTGLSAGAGPFTLGARGTQRVPIGGRGAGGDIPF